MWTDIESAAVDKGAEGVTLTGLDPNTYLLIESKAPTGYNLLSEGVQFEVKQYNNTQYEAAGHSYKGFIRDDGKEETDGIYDLAVQNFKGLQLPSTGGIGTLIFTVIGICIMAGAIVFIVAKSKKRNNNEF
jgi:LPXTG-motif cell wall-anchored protein